MGDQQHTPAALPWERHGIHCIGGWVGPRTSLDRCRKSCTTGIRSPDHPACSVSLHRGAILAHIVIILIIIIVIIILTSSVFFNILYKPNVINFLNIVPWTTYLSYTLLDSNIPVRFTISSACNFEYFILVLQSA